MSVEIKKEIISEVIFNVDIDFINFINNISPNSGLYYMDGITGQNIHGEVIIAQASEIVYDCREFNDIEENVYSYFQNDLINIIKIIIDSTGNDNYYLNSITFKNDSVIVKGVMS